MKLRKLLLASPIVGLAPFVGIIAISCGGATATGTSDQAVTNYNLLPTYTGQADQLIALGIRPDYYPEQLNAKEGPFSYLTNPGPLMPMQSEDFIAKFATKLKSLTPATHGPSWWNQFALQDSEEGSDPEYWSHISGDMVLYEHYLLDDGAKTISANTAPKHFNTPETFIETNFRNSRDPYTRLPKNIIQAVLDQPAYNALTSAEKEVVKSLLTVARKIEGLHADPQKLAVDGERAPSGVANKETGSDDESWLYNDFVFARFWHQSFLDSTTYQKSEFKRWEIDPTVNPSDWVFDRDPATNALLYRIFIKSTYRDSEAKIKALVEAQLPAAPATAQALFNGAAWSRTFAGPAGGSAHHPIYEQQEEVGSAPMFEGAMRDNLLYLFTLADRVQRATTNADGQGYKRLEAVFGKDTPRWTKMRTALDNANKISRDLATRMAVIKTLVDRANNPVFGLVTLAPARGVSTIQSSSKFSFLYKEMGFGQPKPTTLTSLLNETNVGTGYSLFNMDDNGWWWNISSDKVDVSNDKVQTFGKQFDFGLLTANDKQFSNLKTDDAVALASLWKERPADAAASSAVDFLRERKVDYNLWNEGLKAPFGLHMLLDQVLKAFDARYRKMIIDGGMSAADYAAQLAKAASWGDYFNKEFLA